MNLRLLQLASPALPVGAYSYSQGLEAAVEAGVVKDAASAGAWIGEVLEHAISRMEAPVFLRLAAAWAERDQARAWRWNEEFIASRESAELRAETLQMGHSLARLARDLGVPGAEALARDELSYPAAFTFVTTAWRIDANEALAAYLYAWIENQVLAAVKCVPLGQTDGQRMLLELSGRVEAIREGAARLEDEDLGNFAPALAMLSSRHETQYTRIFRS